MLSFEPNILVIDDKKDEVKGIIDYYLSQGIGCKYLNADLIDGDDMPDRTYSNVNLIFLDLFYSEQNFDAELCANWIQAVIPEKFFYVLVIWTKDPGRAEEVKNQLAISKRTPFLCILKSKVDFQVDNLERFDYTRLFQEINENMEATPSLLEMGIWKKSLNNAANAIIGNLSFGSDSAVFSNKLKKIIKSYGGTSILTSENNSRKRAILFEAMDSVLISNTKMFVNTEEISQTNQEQLYRLDNMVPGEIDKHLNSWFHFKLEKQIEERVITPGLIAENNHSFFRKHYSIQDDEKINIRLLNQLAGNALVKDIVLVLTRPCDLAQNKFGKNIKLLSGILIQNIVRKPNGKIDFGNGNLPESAKCYEHLHINEEFNNVTLIFDFRYIFSVPEPIFINKFKNLKTFNKELLSEMQVEYSSYSSRLGITQVI